MPPSWLRELNYEHRVEVHDINVKQRNSEVIAQTYWLSAVRTNQHWACGRECRLKDAHWIHVTP